MAVAFNGMFTAVPEVGVRVIVFISTKNESRLVFGGGVSGAAVSVRLSEAVPLPPQFVVQGCVVDLPLHATKSIAHTNRREVKTFRKFMQPPRRMSVEPDPETAAQRLNRSLSCSRRFDR
jgi:hypothetical protein